MGPQFMKNPIYYEREVSYNMVLLRDTLELSCTRWGGAPDKCQLV